MKREIDPQSWFGTREVKSSLPKHFIKASTAITEESYQWVIKKLAGRFITIGDVTESFLDKSYVYFEDPKEAMIYELRWSGGN